MVAPPALDFYSLPEITSSEALNKRPSPEPIHTPVESLNQWLKGLCFSGQITEWGSPGGSISRILPALIAASLNQQSLWVSDQAEALLYPNSWAGLGFGLNKLHFLQDPKPLASLRTVIMEKTFSLLLVDSRQTLQKSDLHFFAKTCRQQGTTLFLFRHFYLSNKNGSPFSQQRINSSYSIAKQSFQLSLIKGGHKKPLNLKFSEVLRG